MLRQIIRNVYILLLFICFLVKDVFCELDDIAWND
jgi:hypothetical protein